MVLVLTHYLANSNNKSVLVYFLSRGEKRIIAKEILKFPLKKIYARAREMAFSG